KCTWVNCWYFCISLFRYSAIKNDGRSYYSYLNCITNFSSNDETNEEKGLYNRWSVRCTNDKYWCTRPTFMLYFSGAGIDKTTLRSTTLAYYLFVYFASLMMQISFGGTNKET